MTNTTPKPDKGTMLRVEELLREQLAEQGENVTALEPQIIAKHMQCAVHASGALCYSWKGLPLLDVTPEQMDDGTICWRFFTRE